MVSDRQLQVWQSDGHLYIESRYLDDPPFTLEQEKALHTIARSFLLENRQRERRRRYSEFRKQKQKKGEN